MKTYLIMILFLCSIALLSSMPSGWTEFQKDIGIQAAQFKNSPEQHAYRQQNNSRHYVVGDTNTFWRWNLAVMPPTWVQTPATCRAVGEHCYVFVADSDWNSHMTQANVDSVLVRLEQNTPNNPSQGAIEMDINLFGPIPDALDNDPKLIVFYSALGSFQGTSFDGYFSAYNQVTEAQAQQMNPPGHSNECEMIYMTCSPLSPVSPIRLSVLAHELEHLIHWGQDANEEAWIDEGCAELAMVAYGIPDPISGFPSNPDNDLTVWNQQTADYVKVMLFFTYLKEHYDESGLIRDLVADPLNGMTSLTNQLATHYPDMSIAQLLSNWTAANAIDAPQPFDGLYDYTELDLPAFTMTNMNAYPTQSSQPVSAYAADYLKYTLPEGTTTCSIVCNYSIYIKVLLFNAMNECTDVLDNGVGPYDGTIPSGTHHVVFVLTNFSTGGVTYYYSISSVGNDDNISPSLAAASIVCYPNPFRSENSLLEITVSADKNANNPGSIDIYNVKGQHIRRLDVAKSADTKELHANWNGRNDDNAFVSAGIYLIRYTDGKHSYSKSVCLTK